MIEDPDTEGLRGVGRSPGHTDILVTRAKISGGVAADEDARAAIRAA